MVFKQLQNIVAILELKRAKISGRRYISYLQKKGVVIGNHCRFYGGLKTISIDISRPSLIEIGDDVAFNKNFRLVTHDYVSKVFLITHQQFISSSGRIKIGNNVSFGMDCTVLKNVTIGDNCFIGLGSIVSKDIPANSVAMGRPAKVICTIDEYFDKRKNLAVHEALDYALSIQQRFNRRPRIEEFWEEFPLFLDGNESCESLPIAQQLGPAYNYYRENHKAIFDSFDDFLDKAGVK